MHLPSTLEYLGGTEHLYVAICHNHQVLTWRIESGHSSVAIDDLRPYFADLASDSDLLLLFRDTFSFAAVPDRFFICYAYLAREDGESDATENEEDGTESNAEVHRTKTPSKGPALSRYVVLRALSCNGKDVRIIQKTMLVRDVRAKGFWHEEQQGLEGIFTSQWADGHGTRVMMIAHASNEGRCTVVSFNVLTEEFEERVYHSSLTAVHEEVMAKHFLIWNDTVLYIKKTVKDIEHLLTRDVHLENPMDICVLTPWEEDQESEGRRPDLVNGFHLRVWGLPGWEFLNHFANDECIVITTREGFIKVHINPPTRGLPSCGEAEPRSAWVHDNYT
jgi:hypothetical protein